MAGTAGYSGTPLVRKLGLKPGMRVRLLDEPDDYWALLGGDPDELEVEPLGPRSRARADFTHVFAEDARALARHVDRARPLMAEDGMIWVSWPKKSSGVDTDIDRGAVMAVGHDAGLVDIKVCAVDETWSGLKFVIPVSDRST